MSIWCAWIVGRRLLAGYGRGGGNCEIGDENVNDTVVSRELAESEGLFQDPACCASENECKCFLVSGGNL